MRVISKAQHPTSAPLSPLFNSLSASPFYDHPLLELDRVDSKPIVSRLKIHIMVDIDTIAIVGVDSWGICSYVGRFVSDDTNARFSYTIDVGKGDEMGTSPESIIHAVGFSIDGNAAEVAVFIFINVCVARANSEYN